MSADSTFCLENFAVTREDKFQKILGRLENKSLDKNQYNQKIEVLRSSDPENIDDILNMSAENDIRVENSSYDSHDNSYGMFEKNVSMSEGGDDAELDVTGSSDYIQMDQNQ